MKKILLAVSLGLASFSSTSLISEATEGIKMPLINGGHNYDVEGYVPMSQGGLNILVSKTIKPDEDGPYSYDAYVLNLESGNTIKDFGKWYENDVIVNDDATYYVYSEWDYEDGYISLLQYSTGFEDHIPLNIEGSPKGFLKNTDIFIYTNGELYAYDLETNREIFNKPVGSYQMIKVGPDIAIVRDDSITILGSNGEFKDVLEFDSMINSVEYTQDGTKMLVATRNEDLKIYNTTNYQLESTMIPNTQDINGLIIDATNSYLASTKNGKFILYNLENGDRIYTEKDDVKVHSDRIALSDEAKYILIGKNVYSGKNISTYIKSISLTENELQLGHRYTPSVEVTHANGVKEVVQGGVTWKTNNMDVAYIDSKDKNLVASHLGEVDVLVNYLDFTVQQKLKVVDTEKPVFSGVEDFTAYTNTDVDPLQGIKALDTGNGDLTDSIKILGSFNPNVAGKYTLTYVVKDASGNESEAKRKITLQHNPTKNMHFYNKEFYVSKNLYNKKFVPLKTPTVMTYVDTTYGLSSGFGVEIKTTKKQNLKKLTISANGKTWSKSLKGSAMSSKNTESVFKTMNEKDRKWLKDNINPKKKVTAKIMTKQKTIQKTFTSKELQGLLDGVYMYEYLKNK